MEKIFAYFILIGLPLLLSALFFYAIRRRIPHITARPSLLVKCVLGLAIGLGIVILAFFIFVF